MAEPSSNEDKIYGRTYPHKYNCILKGCPFLILTSIPRSHKYAYYRCKACYEPISFAIY